MAIKFLNTVAVDTNVLYVDAASNEVGINTTDGGYALRVNGQIYSESSTYPVYYLKRNTSATGGSFSTLTGIASSFKLETDSTGTITDGFGGGIVFSIGDTSPNTAARIYARRDGGDQTGALQFWGGSNGDTTLMTMRASGKVGIGDTDPGAKLVVAQPQITSGGFSTPFIELKSTAQTDNTGLVAMSFSTSTADNYGYSIGALRGSSGGASSFVISHHDNSLTGSERMRIDSSGRLTIGPMTASQKLNVNGNVTANRYYGNTSTAYYVDPNETGTAIYTAGDIRAASTKGFTSDGLGKLYAWRAVDNTLSNTTNYVKIATLTGTASGSDYFSDRCIIELAGRSTSYSNNQLPAMGYIVAQLQSDDSWDVVYYNHHNGDDEVVDEVGVVQTGYITADIYVRVGSYAEVTASGHISDGHIAVDNTRSGSAPSGYSAANAEYKVWNSGNDGSGSTLDADLLDGQEGSYYANKDHIRSLGTITLNDGTTTSDIISEIENFGAFDSYTSVFKTNWSYAGNSDLSDAGRLTELAGTSWLTWTDNSSDSTRGNITALVIAPNTGGSAHKMFVYNDQGSSYSPGWREIWTSASDGSGSGLDADLLDGVQGASFLRSDAADTWSGDISTTSTNGIRFGSSNQTDSNDGYIAAGRFGSGLNIIGTQTTAGTGRQIRVWGDLITNSGQAFWHGSNDGSGSGLDADLLDGVQGSGYLRSDANDTFTGKLSVGDTNIRRAGIYGLYDSYKIGHIWSMGTGFNIANDGADFGNLYGLAYKHTNNTTGGTMGGSHQMVWCNNGSARGSIGNNAVWHAESMKAPIFYDSNNTAYYLDPNNTSFLKNVNVHGTFRFQRSATTQTGQDDNVTVTLGDSDITFTHNNDDDGDASRYNFKYTSGGSAVDIFSFDKNFANFTTPYVRCTNNSTDYVQLESNSSGGILKAVSNGATNVLFRSYGDSYTLNDFGVGVSAPAYELDVDGTIRATGDVIAYSDVRVKENIKTIDSALDKVKNLRGVEYNKIDSTEKNIGVIAQEVEKILPEVVKEDEEGMKSVAYGNITAVLIEAIKEQQKQIDELKSIINGSS